MHTMHIWCMCVRTRVRTCPCSKTVREVCAGVYMCALVICAPHAQHGGAQYVERGGVDPIAQHQLHHGIERHARHKERIWDRDDDRETEEGASDDDGDVIVGKHGEYVILRRR